MKETTNFRESWIAIYPGGNKNDKVESLDLTSSSLGQCKFKLLSTQ